MTKKKVLIPIDGTEKSLIALNYLKNNFKPEDVEVTIINVREIVFINGLAVEEEIKDAEVIGKSLLREASEKVEEFNCKREFSFGYAGDQILNYAENNDVDIIIMAKNTKKKFTALVGSVTEHVVKRAKCIVIIIPELY